MQVSLRLRAAFYEVTDEKRATTHMGVFLFSDTTIALTYAG